MADRVRIRYLDIPAELRDDGVTVFDYGAARNWDDTANSTPVADIAALSSRAREYSVPIDVAFRRRRKRRKREG